MKEKIIMIRETKDSYKKELLREKIILEQKEWIEKLAYKYAKNSKSTFDDYVQEGYMAVNDAIDDYEVDSPAAFSTFARPRVINRMQRQKTIDGNLNSTAIKLTYKMRRLREDGKLTEDEIRKKCGISKERQFDLNRGICSITSLETQIGDGLTLQSTLSSSETPETVYVRERNNKTIKDYLVEHLSQREVMIIVKRFGLGDKRQKTLVEISEDLGITKQRVQQICEQALQKLKSHSTILKELLLDTDE